MNRSSRSANTRSDDATHEAQDFTPHRMPLFDLRPRGGRTASDSQGGYVRRINSDSGSIHRPDSTRSAYNSAARSPAIFAVRVAQRSSWSTMEPPVCVYTSRPGLARLSHAGFGSARRLGSAQLGVEGQTLETMYGQLVSLCPSGDCFS